MATITCNATPLCQGNARLSTVQSTKVKQLYSGYLRMNPPTQLNNSQPAELILQSIWNLFFHFLTYRTSSPLSPFSSLSHRQRHVSRPQSVYVYLSCFSTIHLRKIYCIPIHYPQRCGNILPAVARGHLAKYLPAFTQQAGICFHSIKLHVHPLVTVLS